MSERVEDAAARPISGSRAWLVLLALVAGLILGAATLGIGDGVREPVLQAATLVGGLWLDALKMTVIPLIVALLVTGIVRGAEAARGGRIAGRTVIWIIAICTGSAVVGALAMPALLQAFPLPDQAAEALRTGLAAVDPAAASAPVPGPADFFGNIIPPNVIAAAAEDAVLPLVVFSLVFALAVVRIADQRRRALVGLFEAIADALLVVIGWVLWLAPIGIFALAVALGASAGGAAFAALLHYVVLVSAVGILVMLAGYGVAVLGGRLGPAAFSKGMIGPQSVAISTRSSLASLPAMLASARLLGIRDSVADVSLPLSVALFRATGPAMNAAVVFYLAHWLGFEPTLGQAIAATAVAAVMSYGSISLPGEISFITSTAPIAMALGVPIAPLALFVAVEMVPDIFRTLGNVTMDVAVAGAVDRGSGESPSES